MPLAPMIVYEENSLNIGLTVDTTFRLGTSGVLFHIESIRDKLVGVLPGVNQFIDLLNWRFVLPEDTLRPLEITSGAIQGQIRILVSTVYTITGMGDLTPAPHPALRAEGFNAPTYIDFQPEPWPRSEGTGFTNRITKIIFIPPA